MLFIFVIPGGCCIGICYWKNRKKCNRNVNNCLFTRTSNTVPTPRANDDPQRSHVSCAITPVSRTTAAVSSSPSNRDVEVVKMADCNNKSASISDSNDCAMLAPPTYFGREAPPPYSNL